jgi:hypothetical protein
MRPLLALSLLALLAFPAACSSDYPGCTKDTDCREPRVCSAQGLCVEPTDAADSGYNPFLPDGGPSGILPDGGPCPPPPPIEWWCERSQKECGIGGGDWQCSTDTPACCVRVEGSCGTCTLPQRCRTSAPIKCE